MVRQSRLLRVLAITLLVAFASTVLVPSAMASNFRVSFKNTNIEITSPTVNQSGYNGHITITGKSSLDTVYLAFRGPGGEMTVNPVNVTNGAFALDTNLRFGQGTYTVWAGSDSRRFDGSIRFEVVNDETATTAYLTESAYVDSEHPLIQEKLAEITNENMTDIETLKAIHAFVASNVAYDYELFRSGENILTKASDTLQALTGTCRDYSFLFAALSRAAGIETKVVYGDASTSAWGTALHAWNEAYVNGEWISIDTTWDAGFLRNGSFVQAPTTKYFNPNAAVFGMTHTPTIYTTH